MIDFSALKGLRIPEGVVTKVESGGVVLWKRKSGIVLEVEKITSDTYAASTTHTGEMFILLDIYPSSGGTVTVTYGGLTKTIIDDGTSEDPNAQQVFFGTFNGVSDEVETPASGTLTIDGDCVGFAVGAFTKASKGTTSRYGGIRAVADFGNVTFIPAYAFYGCESMTNITIPDGITKIPEWVFGYCKGLTSITIPNTVTEIGVRTFSYNTALESITIPDSVNSISQFAFGDCSALASVTFENTVGWYVTDTFEGASGTEVDVSDPANNATLLIDTYKNLYWYRR